jgi:hypothetical protein
MHVFRDNRARDAAAFCSAREGVYLAVLSDELEFDFIATQFGAQQGSRLATAGNHSANVLKGLTHAHAHGSAV